MYCTCSSVLLNCDRLKVTLCMAVIRQIVARFDVPGWYQNRSNAQSLQIGCNYQDSSSHFPIHHRFSTDSWAWIIIEFCINKSFCWTKNKTRHGETCVTFVGNAPWGNAPWGDILETKFKILYFGPVSYTPTWLSNNIVKGPQQL